MNVAVTQELAPIKFCFFIKPKSVSSFRKVMQFSHSLWGGQYNPIVPLYKKFTIMQRRELRTHLSPSEFYFNFFENFNPDIIVYEDTLDKTYLKSIISDRPLIELSEFEKQLQNNNLAYGLSIIEILKTVLSKEFKFQRNDDMKFILPNLSNRDVHLYYSTKFPTNKIQKIIEQSLAEQPYFEVKEISQQNLIEYLIDRNFIIGDLGSYQIRARLSVYHQRVFIYCYDPSSFVDLIYLWNIRASSRKGVELPINNYNEGYYNNAIINLSKDLEKKDALGLTIIKGYSLNIAQFEEVSKYVKTIIESLDNKIQILFQNWLPSLGETKETADYNGISCNSILHESNYNQLETTSEDWISYTLLKPNFQMDEKWERKSYKVTSWYHFYDSHNLYPNVITGIDGLDWTRLTQGFIFSDVRISKGGVVTLAQSKDKIGCSIPKSIEYLKVFFAKKNFRFIETPKGKLSNQIYANIGGLHGILQFTSKGAIQVLQEFEDGKVVAYEQILSAIKREKPKHYEKTPLRFIEQLVDKRIIELGVKVQCVICLQRSFIPLDDIKSEIICNHCRAHFTVPKFNPKDTFKWSYVGTGPYTKNNKVDGLFTSFLAINLFNHGLHRADDNITSAMNFILKQKNNEYEIDLFLQLRQRRRNRDDTEIIFCECKTYNSFSQKDIDRMTYIGRNFKNSILAFCTLKNELSQDEIELIRPMVEIFRNGFGNRAENPVFILTSNELLPDNEYEPFAHYGEIHLSIRYSDYLGYLCDQSTVKYLGMESWSNIQRCI